MARRSRRSTTSALKSSTSLSSAAEIPERPASSRDRWIIGGAVVLGAVLWIVAGNDMPASRWAVLLVAVGISLIPQVTQALAGVLEWLRRPSHRATEWTAVIVGVGAAAYLTFTAFLQERPLAPRMIDERSYAISAQLLAHGRLWLPQHPLPDFFDSFFLVSKPVYSSIYFPGTAIAFAPGVWLGWGTWVLPVVLSGICVALLYRIVTALSGDGAAGLLAALWMVSMMPFRALSVMTMSQVVMLFLGLLMVWAWLRWRENRRWTWTLLIGALAGWAAITRPVDALAYALPVGVAMFAGLRGQSIRRWASTAGLLVLGAAPFLSLQVAHNIGVTGNPLRTPYTDYLEREQPGAQFGVRRYDPAWRPASASSQMQKYYDWVRPYLELHQPHNFLQPWFSEHRLGPTSVRQAHFVTVAENTLPARALLLLLPAGILALAADRRRWVLAATLPLFLVLYALNPFFLPHYLVVVTPAMILLVVLGIDAVARSLSGRWNAAVRVALTTVLFMLAVTSLWEVKWLMSPDGQPVPDGFQESARQSAVESSLGPAVTQPAVVLFTAPPDPWTEMVYNIDVASPDDAPIIRAHDLGERNVELIDYYAERQPQRTFYHFDFQSGRLRRLGQAGELREMLRGGKPAKTVGTQPG